MFLEDASPFLEEEGVRILSRFQRELGSNYREEELKRCDLNVEELKLLRKKIFSESPARVKLSVTLCLSAAMSAVILLW